MSDTIRKQGERIKELEAVKPCKCKQPTKRRAMSYIFAICPVCYEKKGEKE